MPRIANAGLAAAAVVMHLYGAEAARRWGAAARHAASVPISVPRADRDLLHAAAPLPSASGSGRATRAWCWEVEGHEDATGRFRFREEAPGTLERAVAAHAPPSFARHRAVARDGSERAVYRDRRRGWPELLREESPLAAPAVCQALEARGDELLLSNACTLASDEAVREQTDLLLSLLRHPGLRLAEWRVTGGRFEGDRPAAAGSGAEQLLDYLATPAAPAAPRPAPSPPAEGTMQQTTTGRPAGQRLYLIGAALAAAALLFGLWDLLVERDGGSWLWQAVLPAALLALMLALARRPAR